MHLPDGLARRPRVDRAPDKQVERAAAGAVRDERAPACAHREPDAARVHVDPLGGLGRRAAGHGHEDNGDPDGSWRTFPPSSDPFYLFQSRFMLRVSRRLLLSVAFALALVYAADASASQLIDRDASGVRLAVNAQGEALLTYRAHGGVQHVRAWGAINARYPNPQLPQAQFRKDYSGRAWLGFHNACRAYSGPRLAFFVTGCTAPDGSYWAVQSWRRTLPNFDARPRPGLGARELHLSHWSGETATLEAWTDWVYGGRYHHLFGRLTYGGRPVYGFSATRVGAPTDGYVRNVYVDTFDSRYGKGWRRENAFLAHALTGG